MTGPEEMASEGTGSDETPSDRNESAAEADFRETNPNAGGPEGLAGGMGVSSEIVGDTGPGQVSTDGLRRTGADAVGEAVEATGRGSDDAPPEQSEGGAEPQPGG